MKIFSFIYLSSHIYLRGDSGRILMEEGGKEKRTGADEAAGNRRGPGRPPGPPLSEEKEKEKIKRDEKIRKDREYRAKRTSQLKEYKEYKEFCEKPEIAVQFKAFKESKQKFKEALNQLDEVWMEDGTNKDIEMLTRSSVAGMGTIFEPPTRELKRKREEELAEARRCKVPATADNYTLCHIPIGGSQPSGLMANAPQTARQSALPGHSSRKVAQQNEEPKWINLPVQKQHDTYYVPECCTEVVISKKLDQFRSEMQERLQWMEDNIKLIQRLFVAAPTQFRSCLQANAPIVSPTEPHHDPHGMQGGTNAAAGSSGRPVTQSFPYNEEKVVTLNSFDCDTFNPWLEQETFTGILAGSPNFASGAICSSATGGDSEILFDLDDFDPWPEHEMFIGNLAGSSNVASNTMNSTATGEEPHHDPLGMQGETIAAAGCSGGCTTQSSPHNEKF